MLSIGSGRRAAMEIANSRRAVEGMLRWYVSLVRSPDPLFRR
jgi:hypothetical protein